MVATNVALRYTEKHTPLVSTSGPDRYTCRSILSDGTTCNRRCNFVGTDRYPESGTPLGHWRHNPRPYVNY